MPVTIPPAAALKEFLGATTRHTRRVEIYEADGVTRWYKDTTPRLKDGAVTVDYSRDERRALDLTLSNSDGVLVNAAGEFWYDKIIKVFRGVQVREARREPKLLVISDDPANDTSVAFRTMMSQIGYGDVRVAPLVSTLAELNGYDIIVTLSANSAPKNQLVRDAYAAGYNILTIGGGSVANRNTLYGASGTTDTALGLPISVAPRAITHPVAAGWSNFAYDGPSQSVVTAASVTNTAYTSIANTGAGSVVGVFQNQYNTRWFMFGLTALDTTYSIDQFRNLMISAMAWLNPVVALDTWEVQIGEFMIDKISEPHFPHEVKITGRDYTKKCLLSKFARATQFATGQTLEALIASIAGAAGITKRILPVTGITVGRTFFFERGVDRWAAMKEICNAYNYEIYFDATGYLVIRPYNDPVATPPVIYIETGKDGQLASYEKATSDARLYNHIVVTGESSDSSVIPVSAEAINNDPTSPTSVAELGDRLYQYTSSFITTQAQARDVADSFLAVHSLEEFELSFESLLLPWLEVGDILGWIDPDPAPDDPDTFLLSSLSIPLGLAPMSGMGKRVMNSGAYSYMKLLATFSGGNTAPGTVPPADTGQAFAQNVIGGSGTSNWQVLNGRAIEQGIATESYLTTNTGIANGTFSAELATLPNAASSAGLAVRMSSPTDNNCIFLDASGPSSDRYTLYKRVAGTWTTLGTILKQQAPGDILRIAVNGTTVTASVGGVFLTVTVADAALQTGTYMAIRGHGSVAGKTASFESIRAVY